MRHRIPILLVLLTAATLSRADEAVPARLEFNRDVRSILSDKCFKCHGPDVAARQAKLRLDLRDEALAELDGGTPIVPGHIEQSEVVRRIESTDDEERMPPRSSNLRLSPREIAILRQWISEGAEYQPHWSLLPPRAAALPAVKKSDWGRNAIDRFSLAVMEREGLSPSDEADRPTQLRRVTLALTGLPPTLTELDQFLADDSPAAYENVVERLFRSPRFGERMSLDWLDAARYADTNGYFTDEPRVAWPWRDWVIGAFNANLPFDRFTIEQLAGDLLPNATTAQKIATGFNRSHMVSNETGLIDEEYRLGYVADRVDTTATVWLGLTIGCARCHDHKYDPISQREYYRLFAAFNNISEAGLVTEIAPISPAPALTLPTAGQEERLAALGAQRGDCETRLKSLKPKLDNDQRTWEETALTTLAPAPTTGGLVHFDFEQEDSPRGESSVRATTHGTLTLNAAVRGKGGVFDGTQYIEFTEPQPLERDRPFSLSIWFKTGSAPQSCLVSKQDAKSEARGFEIIWYKQQPRVTLAHRADGDSIELVARQTYPGQQWHQMVVTYDGSSQAAGLLVYINGQLVPMTVKRDSLTGSVASAEPWHIGWKGTGIGFDGGLDEFRLFDRVLSADEITAMHWREFMEGTLAIPPGERTKPQLEKLESYYITHHGSDEVQQLSKQLIALRAEEAAARKQIVSVSVMQELDKPRATHVLTRGQYDQPGEAVEFGVPAALNPLPVDAPQNRLGVALWLVAKENPLTARVAVNRLWQQCFGEGLVRTLNDFGLQGESCSHPELLDWLAVRFRDGDDVTPAWDLKAMLKLIVTSATFRQKSGFTRALLARDPENRLFARGPRHRLGAESLRDQSLAIGGLLVDRVGGPSVKPYQPSGLWEVVSYNGEAVYETDTGESLYRRSLYTYWKRQSPPPGILIFDGPTREVCSVRRPRTNTPLQALALLNDVTYVEAARGLAARLMRDGGRDTAARVQHGFRLATGRLPNATEVAALQHHFNEQWVEFRTRPESAKTLLQSGESLADPTLDPCELAAWTMTAAVILNLDEVLTQH